MSKAISEDGTAIGANPLLIGRPCHRAIGADGSLTGYAGGLDRERQLLDLEGGPETGGTAEAAGLPGNDVSRMPLYEAAARKAPGCRAATPATPTDGRIAIRPPGPLPQLLMNSAVTEMAIHRAAIVSGKGKGPRRRWGPAAGRSGNASETHGIRRVSPSAG